MSLSEWLQWIGMSDFALYTTFDVYYTHLYNTVYNK